MGDRKQPTPLPPAETKPVPPPAPPAPQTFGAVLFELLDAHYLCRAETVEGGRASRETGLRFVRLANEALALLKRELGR